MFYNIKRIFAGMAGLYIHIPFCEKRCHYCDFFSSVSMHSRKQYLQALVREMELRADYLQQQSLRTIYLGGGTPTQLQVAELGTLLEAVFTHFNTLEIEQMEISLEANPDDINLNYLKALRTLPFNRLSIGVQSFHDTDLHQLNRRHNAQQALQAVQQAQDLGFDNISIDLMFGLPQQSLAQWQKNLQTVQQLNIQHVSAYHLIYEPGTPLYRMLQAGKVQVCNEELSNRMYQSLLDYLSLAGLQQYEIANFALPGYESKHNTSYWRGEHYLGLGASAHSFNSSSRQWNVSHLQDYIRGIKTDTVPAQIEEINADTAYNEYILTGLRTRWGIELMEIEKRFGLPKRLYCEKRVQKHLQTAHVFQQNGTLTISPSGLFLSDGIMSDLMFVP